ncbi:hypothetical protein MVEN_00090800 [Mycena venus]|uniref:HTH CENPB-type domain-containing protein n=1 Tax=Mycena venus TaxID=2733690 RepID=A0A8H6Z9P0_9AGAR|nr:hypothetical protein MVEN_00090800 [Mycena venus]
MVSRAKSDRVKGHENSRRKELNVKAALHEYEREQVKPAEFGKAKSIKAIAESHKVPYATLHRRIHGGRSIGEVNQEKQKLTVVQEWSLVQFILEAAERGFPLSHAQIVQYADAVRQATLGADCERVGVKWVFAFLDRHHHELRPFWSKALDTQRARSLNPEAVKSWVALVQKYVVDMGVSPDRVYGMDESGFPTGYTGKERVIGARGTKTQHKQGSASRQNITALVTIRGDGKMVVPPMIIFPGVNFQTAWGNGNTIKAFIAKSVNGWTNGELGYLWLAKVFDPATKAEANGLPRVLLLDGHSSHYTEKFINFARANNIILLGYPPHCTHALQGLDVSKIVAFEAEKMREVSKAEFLSVWAPAYVEAFDESTVCGAFKVTGVVPFNPNFVTEEQMKPSVATSTRAEFPMPQPSAVEAIVDVMRVPELPKCACRKAGKFHAINIARASSIIVLLNLLATPFDECAYGAGFWSMIPRLFNHAFTAPLVSSLALSTWRTFGLILALQKFRSTMLCCIVAKQDRVLWFLQRFDSRWPPDVIVRQLPRVLAAVFRLLRIWLCRRFCFEASLTLAE